MPNLLKIINFQLQILMKYDLNLLNSWVKNKMTIFLKKNQNKNNNIVIKKKMNIFIVMIYIKKYKIIYIQKI